jgi:branched-chain amino acid transport system substrate-binding protein
MTAPVKSGETDMLSRRSAIKTAAGIAATSVLGMSTGAQAADKEIKVGINMSFTGADSQAAARAFNGAMMAFDEANAKKTVKGYVFKIEKYDDATATAGQYDPAQAATNARRMVSDKAIIAAVGPLMSGAGKAMSPILSAGNLAIITPSSTNPDITDPKFIAQYRPNGKAIYFRTVTTDAYQGPNMANYMADVLKVKKIYLLDDSGAYGVGLTDAFEGQCKKKGIEVVGRDRLDPKAADYSAVLTKIKATGVTAMYYGGVSQAGVKLAKQAFEIIPTVIKAGGDGMFSTDLLTAVGFPAVDGWYATQASPHLTEETKLQNWVKAFADKYKMQPDDYTITANSAAVAIIDAAKKIAASGKPVTRDAVRDGLQAGKFDTLQGIVEFDENGDLKSRVVSVYQIKKDDKKPLDSPEQYKYLAVAPQA